MSKKNKTIFSLKNIRNYLSQNEGLGFLQIFNLMKTFSVVVVSIIFAKVVKNHFLIAQWETLMLLSGGFTFFYVSGLGYTLLSFIKKYKAEKYDSIFKSSFLLLFVLGIISSLAIVFTELFTSSIKTDLTMISIFGLYILGNVCSSVLEYFFIIKKQFSNLILWGIFNFITYIVTPFLLVLELFDFDTLILYLSSLGLIKLILTLKIIENPFKYKNLGNIKPLLRFNIPVILSLMLGSGYVYVANFIIKTGTADSDFNIFRYGSREFPLFVVLANSFSIVLGSTVASDFEENDFWIKLRRNHRRLIFQVFIPAIILAVFSPYIFKALFSEQFISSYRIFNILLLTVIARVLFPQSLLMGRGITRFSFYAAFAEFVTGILLSYYLLKTHGIIGVAWAITIAFFVEKLVLIFFCYRFKIAFHKSINFKWYLLFSVLLILCFLLNN